MDPGPVLVTEMRNGHAQAVHTGHAARLAPDGAVVEAWGDPERPTYWRSAPKPLQAIPFAEVLDRFQVGHDALALACASHSAQPEHVALARRMLEAAGLSEADLRCATHPAMTRHSGPEPEGGWTPLYNNCSGKHAGMLAACLAHGWPMATYLEPDHPLQQRIVGLLQEATGKDRFDLGIDGCGLPTFWLPVADLARTYQWLDGHEAGRAGLDAMAAHPWLVGGTGRADTAFIEAGRGDVVSKVGAAGVYVMLHRPSGEALALKVASGNGRAAESLAAHLAVRAGWFDAASREGIGDILDRPVRDCAGAVLGRYEVHL